MIDDALGNMDLALLAALRVLLATESVTAAARQLGTTQPNMSRTLARLRTLFHDPLLVATGRRMERTARARELQPRVERALDAMRQLFELTEEPIPGRERRVVRVAASDYATAVVLRPWVHRLRRVAPGIVVRVEPASTDSIDPLARGELDLAIAPRIPLEGMEQFVVRKLVEDRLVCVVRKGHPRAHAKKSLRLEEYLALEHVAVSNARPNVSALQAALQRLGHTRNVVLTVPSFLSALSAVAETNLAAALPEKLVRTSGAKVAVYALPFPLEAISLHMIWHPRRTTEPYHRWLRKSLARTS